MVDATEFKATIQGHYQILDEKNPELRRSVAASRHYSDYDISDSVIARHHGKRKGIKLGFGGVEVIEAFQKAVETLTKAPKEHRAVRIYQSDKALIEAIFDQLGLDGKTQQDKMRAFLHWAQAQIDSLSESVEETLPPPPAAPSETDARLNKVIEAVAMLTELQLQQQVTRQGDQQKSSAPPKQASPKTTKAQPQEEEQAVTSHRSSLRQANTERLHRAIDAIIAYNDSLSREEHDKKWAITINALKGFVNSQPKIQAILSERKQEMEAHHEAHEIDPATHNLRHRKEKIEEIIPFSP